MELLLKGSMGVKYQVGIRGELRDPREEAPWEAAEAVPAVRWEGLLKKQRISKDH
jgi:hypothetical protein